MGRKSDAPTRSEITDTIEKHKDDMSEKIEELDLIATDTETVRETLESLEFDGTAEGGDAVEEAIEQADDVTVEVFEGEDENLEEIQSATEEYEGELQERSDSSESDLEKVSEASDQITTEETKDELERAKEGVRDDMDFINEENQAASEAREENERLQQEHRGRVQSRKR